MTRKNSDAVVRFFIDLSNKGALKGVSDLDKKSAELTNRFSSTGKSLTLGLTTPIVGLGTVCTKMAMDFDHAFAKVSTLLDSSAVDYKKYKNEILSASTDMGVGVNEYSEAVYQALSAGVDQADAISFVREQVKLAKGGFADLTTAVDTTTSIMNAYGKETYSATQVNDMLITTQNKGKTTVAELGASIAQVTPTASAMKVSFEQVAASLAVMTAQGTPTAQATTQLNALIAELGKEGTIAAKSFETAQKKMGLVPKTFNEMMSEGYTLNDVLYTMADYASENNMQMIDLFSSIEAGKSAMSIVSSGQEFNNVLDEMKNKSGQTEDAYGKMADTAEERLNKALVGLKNSGTELGANLLPIVVDLVNGISKLVKVFNNLSKGQKQTIVTIAKMTATIGPLLIVISKLISFGSKIGTLFKIIKGGTPIIKALNLALNANPVMLIVGAIIILIGIFISLWNNCEGFRNFWIGLWEGIKKVTLGAINGIKNIFMGIVDFFKKNWKTMLLFFVNPFAGIFKLIYDHCEGFRNFINFFVSGIKNIMMSIVSFVYNNILLPIFNFVKNGFLLIVAVVATVVGTIGNILLTIVSFIYNNILLPIYNFFAMIFNAIWNGIVSGVNFITGIFISFVSFIYNNILLPIFNFFSSIWNGIWNVISSVIDKVKNGFNYVANFVKTVFSNVKNFISHIFSTVAGVIKTPINGVIGLINNVLKSLNKVKVPDWVPGLGGSKVNLPLIPKLATGTNYVQKEGLAYLHEGEAVVPKKYNPVVGGNFNSQQNVYVTVIADMDVNKFGKAFVNDVKTFSGGAKNSYNYGGGK